MPSEAPETENSSRERAEGQELLGVVLRGEFRIIEPLGSGGMSRVYRAHQTTVDREVVVKVMTPPPSRTEEWRARFMQEARAASRVSHPGIVTIYSFGEEDGVGPFIAMERVHGRTLRRALAISQKMSPARACALMAQVCRAMHAAHEVGVIHRDLKPDNIMIEIRDENEVARVLDFGIAKPSDSVVNTLDEHVVGTPDYMAPEQSRKNPIDARTDVYSAGVILYELLFGKRPFSAPDPLTLMFKHVTEPLPLHDFDPAWPESVADILARACAKDPVDRYESAREMAIALDGVVSLEESERTGVSSGEFVAQTSVTPAPYHPRDLSAQSDSREESEPTSEGSDSSELAPEDRDGDSDDEQEEVEQTGVVESPQTYITSQEKSESEPQTVVLAGVLFLSILLAITALWLLAPGEQMEVAVPNERAPTVDDRRSEQPALSGGQSAETPTETSSQTGDAVRLRAAIEVRAARDRASGLADGRAAQGERSRPASSTEEASRRPKNRSRNRPPDSPHEHRGDSDDDFTLVEDVADEKPAVLEPSFSD